ncbi:DUF4403 family protein [Pontibacter sp. MBLB2868]|uniref:DUF4403 family protein n=1 Tax=Pontibacter sp. MBLB2868 TaxID=3451555 RepID=UPI003F752567
MENAIKIQLPVSISYPALESALQKQMVGEFIPKPEEGGAELPYAQILDIGITKSSTGPADIILGIKIKVLRTIMKRDEVDLFVVATLAYDNATEQLFVQKYKVESRTTSGFYNTALEVLANKVAYSQIIQKTRINLKELITKELAKANVLLEKGLELKGVKVLGKVEQVRVQNVSPQPGRLTLLLEVQGNLEADIFDLDSLMPGNLL